MRTLRVLLPMLLAGGVFGQGTFVYDQQSSDESYFGEGGAALGPQPTLQSFTPARSSVGFIRLHLSDALYGNQSSGTFSVSLRAESITGTVLGSTAPVTLAGGFVGTVDFVFATPVSVTPGTTYYFQPTFMSGGGAWNAKATTIYNYPRGNAFWGDTAAPTWDLWFREGIIVPEPSGAMLLLVGACALAFTRRQSGA